MVGQNRPFCYGANDRRTFITYKSEMEIRCQNDANGNPIYIGRAKVGVLESDDKWQIAYQTYDASDSLLTKEWPQDSFSNASAEYEFTWNDRATYTYS